MRAAADRVPFRNRRWVPWLLGGMLAVVAAVNAQAFWMSTDAGAPAVAVADELPQAPAPVAQRTSAGTVGIVFDRAFSASGRPVAGYAVRRYAPLPATTPESSFTCDWPEGEALACSESGVADGIWHYTVAARIAGSLWEGSESARSAGVLVDTLAPATPSVPDLAAASDSGISSTDNLTNDTAPAFTGTAEAGSTVKIYAGAVLVGSGPATAGTYAITVSPLGEGPHTITATATDLSGNVSAPSGGVALTVDTQAPAAPPAPDLVPGSDSGASSTDNLTNVTSPAFAGSTEPGASVILYSGAAEAGTGSAPGGSYSVTAATVSERVHIFTVRATDAAGNVSSPGGGLTVTVDTTAPLVTATTVAKPAGFLGGAIRESSGYFVYANVSESNGVQSETADVSTITSGSTAVSLTAGSYSSAGLPYNHRSGQLTGTSSLTGGTGIRSYSIVSTDLAGNFRSQTGFTVSLDNIAPAASTVQTSNGGGTSGKADQGDTISFTFTEPVDPHSVLAGWTGASIEVVVRLFDGGCTLTLCNDDSFQVRDASDSAALPLGTVNLSRSDYHGAALLGLGAQTPITFGQSGTPSTMVQSGSTITVTLGSQSGAANGGSGSGTMAWAPSSALYDAAGNNASTGSVNESGGADREF